MTHWHADRGVLLPAQKEAWVRDGYLVPARHDLTGQAEPVV